MKRTRWAALTGVLLVAAATAVVLRPRPVEPFPLAELVPPSARVYAGFPEYRELEELPGPWSQKIREQLASSRAALAGGLAIYIDEAGEWVLLARLTRGSALLAGAAVEDGAAVVAQSPEALARHRARRGSLADLPEFKQLGMRFFFNLEPLKLRGRLHDFSAIGFDRVPGPDLVLRGRALYRGGLFRTYLERYVQAPRHGMPESGGPGAAQVALTEYFPRVWEELTHDALDVVDAGKAEHEAQILSQDFLERQSFREFLSRLGPTWGFSIVPTPFGKPALLVWVDLPDERTRETLAKMVHRGIEDLIKFRRDKGQAPAFEIVADGPLWRVRSAGSKGLRYGEAYQPAYTFEKTRFVYSTCASVMGVPAIPAGESHLGIRIEVPGLIDAARALASQWTDDAFRPEAQRKAALLWLRMCDPGTMTALKRQFPDPADLAKYQEAQKAQFEARALEELSKTLDWKEERTRVEASIEAWAQGLSWVAGAWASGRFTGDGLEFTVSLVPARKP